MKSLLDLFERALVELGAQCRTSTIRDQKTVADRVEHEGVSFLTITLPAFCSDFQKGLDEGRITDDSFSGFSRTSGLPKFLRGFLRLVFDAKDGRLLDRPDIDAIHAVRQLTLMFGKISIECSQKRTVEAMQGFLECEKEVRIGDSQRTPSQKEAFARVTNLLLASALQRTDEDVFYERIIPQHGPGSTADKLLGNRKFVLRQWTLRLEAVFPSLEFLLPSARYHNHLAEIDLLEPGAETPVKVVSVPKTLKAPRIIAIEPTCMQYAQQGISRSLVRNIERDDLLSSFIGFTDQTPNQRMAREGSLSGRLATIDLSEASDRVSNQLVRLMLGNFPNLAEGVDASRSRKADVLGRTVRLAKFASMGSALCFPIEALVFLAVVMVGIEKGLNRRLTRKDLMALKGQVRIYGDDIIVPVGYVHHVVSELETFGFRVNAGKSFWTGKFRESCGKEYYDGHDVSVVKVRHLLPTRRGSGMETVHAITLRNQFYGSGMWGVAGWMDTWLEGLAPYPTVHVTSPVQGRHTLLSYEVQRDCSKLHRPLVKGIVVRSTPPASSLDGVSALLKWFLKLGRDPYPKDHLIRYGRADAADTKVSWAPPY